MPSGSPATRSIRTEGARGVDAASAHRLGDRCGGGAGLRGRERRRPALGRRAPCSRHRRFVLAVALLARSPAAAPPRPRPGALRTYLLCVAAEVVAIPVGALVIRALDRPSDLIVVWVVFVVGVHFLPFARVRAAGVRRACLGALCWRWPAARSRWRWTRSPGSGRPWPAASSCSPFAAVARGRRSGPRRSTDERATGHLGRHRLLCSRVVPWTRLTKELESRLVYDSGAWKGGGRARRTSRS